MTKELNSFEDFIMHCCRLPEWDLRDYLRDNLSAAGFKIQEDKYSSMRPGKYKKIKNMLAVRGDDPRVCLVAHTDVCRDYRGNGLTAETVEPVIKTKYHNGKEIRVIQDKYCQIQVGGDDRLGVAINTWIALNSAYDMGLLFTTEEEVGALSAEECSFPELKQFQLLAEVDRGNHHDQLVINIGGLDLCDKETALRLLQISEDIGMPREPVRGMLTDVLEIKRNKMCKNAVNMTCGYMDSHGSSSDEFIMIEKARDTMKFASRIIRDYEEEAISEMEKSYQKEEEKEIIQNSNIGLTKTKYNGKEVKVYYARSYT